MSGASKIYPTDTVETQVLRGFSLTVEEGEFVSVTGPSGSGKTTFLNIAGDCNTIRPGAPNTHGHLFMPRC
ncbi:MAG: ATP-binding cassette domain-containing protein [Woeseia sp.]|nr:ATP-binding cassette domain-containing protein [Woeseia sp.]